MELNGKAVRRLRLDRQGFLRPVEKEAYGELFSGMSPVRTVYWCCPGDPPVLAFRAAFDDAAENFALRRSRELVKGRFQNGGIAYVRARELPLFGALYRRDPAGAGAEEQRLLELIEREGPLAIHQIKEITGLQTKAITPLLHRLQERFLVFEDQTDNEWDRGWYPFETEFPGLEWPSRREALERIALRFVRLHGAADVEMLRSFYQLPVKELRETIASLLDGGRLVAAELDGEPVVLCPEDEDMLTGPSPEPPACVYALHRNDFLIKSLEHRLKGRYRRDGCDVLHYLLIDGEIRGAVVGHFKNGPFVIEDVLVDLPETEAAAREEEICAAAARVNDPAASPIPRYRGRSR